MGGLVSFYSVRSLSLFLRHGDRSGWGRHLLGTLRSVIFAGIWWGFVSPLHHIPQVVIVLWECCLHLVGSLGLCCFQCFFLCKIHNNYYLMPTCLWGGGGFVLSALGSVSLSALAHFLTVSAMVIVQGGGGNGASATTYDDACAAQKRYIHLSASVVW